METKPKSEQIPSLLASKKFLLLSDKTNSVMPFESKIWWKIVIKIADSPGGMKEKQVEKK